MRLTELQLNVSARLISFDEMRVKLNQLGLYAGDFVQITRIAPFDGPVLIEVNGRMIALGRDIAKKVLVEKI